MYSLPALADLAANHTFRHEVRELGRLLGAHPAVTDRIWIAALARYGPQHPGVALRLLHLDHAVDVSALDAETAGKLTALALHVAAACD